MIVFVVIIAFIIAGLNFFEYKKQVENNEALQLIQVQKNLQSSLETLDKAYLLLDQQKTEEMQENSSKLVEMYEQDGSFTEWDFHALSSELGMDIYIIHNNVVEYSNDEKDIGLDFSVCCQKLIPFFDDIREHAKFSSPGLDVEQKTGLIKKYSYEGTEDGEYIVELGYLAHDDRVFGLFDFLEDIDELKEQYSLIKELRVLNIGGLSLGGEQEDLTDKRREAFEKSLNTAEETEVIDKWKDDEVTYRYVFYESDVDRDEKFNKIIEVVYDHKITKKTIKQSFKTLIIQLIVVITIIALVLLIIHFWVSQHVYSAQHDSLTGLRNRGMFDEKLRLLLEDLKSMHALMMIDLDNFKLVNDTLGHTKGDHVLKIVAHTLEKTVHTIDETSSVYRVGGDEFTIILPETDNETIVQMAEQVNESLRQSLIEYSEYQNLHVSASIGVAVKDKEQFIDAQTLYKQADRALYQCKKEGKDNFCFYTRK